MKPIRNQHNISDEILQGRFLRKKLTQTSQEINSEQQKIISSFTTRIFNNRSFTITDDTMDYKHSKVHRYLDMPTRARKDGTKHKKKSRSIHNRIIMSQYNNLVKELAYGYTEAAKQELFTLES